MIADPSPLSQLDGVVTDVRALAMTTLLAGFLTLSYLVVYALMRLEDSADVEAL